MTAAMFKIRGGKPTYTKPDGSVGTAGKGPLLSDEFAFTLATMHDQTLIAPLNAMTTGFSHSNSDVSLSTRPTPERALTIRSAPTGETAAIIDDPSAPQQPTPPPRGMTLTYVSLFSGIEAFSVAASRIADVDWRPVFFSEIDLFPCAVLAHRFPSVPNLGDVTKIRVEERDNTTTNTKEKVITNGSATVPFPRMGIDILAGGSPCQDVSVAGLRKGMRQGSATRSSLAFEYARLVEELRPRIILWENVPGVLSSRNGLDFRAFLGSLVERGYGLAWRVLDAQFTRTQSFPFAVPQRRRRVWLVGCLGADESVPAQILSLVEGLRGDTPPRRETGKGSASPAGYRADRDDRVVEGAGRAGESRAGAAERGLAAQAPRGDGTGGLPGRVQRPEGEGARASGTVGGGGCDVSEVITARSFKGIGARNGQISGPFVATTSLAPSAPQTEKGKTGRTSASSSASASFDGHDVSATLHKPNGSPGFSDQEIFSQGGGAYLARTEMKS